MGGFRLGAPLAQAVIADAAAAAEVGQCGKASRTAAAGAEAEAQEAAEATAAPEGQQRCRKRRPEDQDDGTLQAAAADGPTAPDGNHQEWWRPDPLLHFLHCPELVISMSDFFFAGKRPTSASSKRRKLDPAPATAALPPAAAAVCAQNGAAAAAAETAADAHGACSPDCGAFVAGRATPAAHTRAGGRWSPPHRSRSAPPAAQSPAGRLPCAAALAAGGVSQHGASSMAAAAATASPSPSREQATSTAGGEVKVRPGGIRLGGCRVCCGNPLLCRQAHAPAKPAAQRPHRLPPAGRGAVRRGAQRAGNGGRRGP